MPKTFNQEYIEEHMLHVHTPESWGRSIAYQIMKEAAEDVGGKDVDSATVNGTFHVAPIEALGCIRICGFGICVHLPLRALYPATNPNKQGVRK